MNKPLLILASILLFFISSRVSAQLQTILKNSYSIQSISQISPDDLTFYTKSIEAVDFEKYRSKTKEVVLEFTNGFKLVLNSADKASLQGLQINSAQYSDELSSDYIYPLFKVDSSGIVVTMHKTRLTKSEIKNNLK